MTTEIGVLCLVCYQKSGEQNHNQTVMKSFHIKLKSIKTNHKQLLCFLINKRYDRIQTRSFSNRYNCIDITTIHDMRELNQNWHINYHKRNRNGITQLVTGPVGLVQLFFIAILGKQNQLTLIEIIPFK